MRVRRSLLWVNGYDMEKLHKGIESEVDSIVLDLEDGVIPANKEEARRKTYDALKHVDFKGKERVVRVNALDTAEFEKDLKEVLPGIPDAIRLPKCETAEYVKKMDQILTELEKENGAPEGSIELILMIETALGVMNCYEMATCSGRVTAVGIGMEDLTSSMQVTRRYELHSTDLLYARQKVILECKAAGVQVIDSGVLFSGDSEFYYQDCLNDKQDGFEGRSVSDFEHVPLVNMAFSPSEKEIDWASRVIGSYEKAKQEARSEVFVDGKYVDPPVVEKAELIMRRYEKIRRKESV